MKIIVTEKPYTIANTGQHDSWYLSHFSEQLRTWPGLERKFKTNRAFAQYCERLGRLEKAAPEAAIPITTSSAYMREHEESEVVATRPRSADAKQTM